MLKLTIMKLIRHSINNRKNINKDTNYKRLLIKINKKELEKNPRKSDWKITIYFSNPNRINCDWNRYSRFPFNRDYWRIMDSSAFRFPREVFGIGTNLSRSVMRLTNVSSSPTGKKWNKRSLGANYHLIQTDSIVQGSQKQIQDLGSCEWLWNQKKKKSSRNEITILWLTEVARLW
jgi:hypothetical protein